MVLCLSLFVVVGFMVVALVVAGGGGGGGGGRGGGGGGGPGKYQHCIPPNKMFKIVVQHTDRTIRS